MNSINLQQHRTIPTTRRQAKYNVIFFGTKETATINDEDACLYAEYKHIHGRPKTDNFRNKKFNQALKEAETSETTEADLKYKESDTLNMSVKNLEESLAEENLLENLENDEDKLKLAAKIGTTREKKIHIEMQRIFEENDRKQNQIINEYKQKIYNLEKDIYALQRNLKKHLTSEQESLSYKNYETETQTDQNSVQNLNSYTPPTDNTTFLIELVEVKSKQHLLEEAIKTLKAEMAKSKSINTHSHSKRPPNKTRPNCNLHTSSANTQSSKKGLKSPLGENQQTEDKLQIKHKLKVILGKGPPMNAKPKAKEESYDDFFNKHIDCYKGLTKHQYQLATGNPAPSGRDGLQAPNLALLGHLSSSSPESNNQTILQAEVYNTDSGNQNTQDCDLDTPTEITSQNNHNTNGSFLAPPHRKFNQYDITLF
ncbi:hypothetical protein J6590_073573 [Homalodisca vitripennis]|nr:hypothetical protein J6590_073573 [Homalodisca vitripennis]